MSGMIDQLSPLIEALKTTTNYLGASVPRPNESIADLTRSDATRNMRIEYNVIESMMRNSGMNDISPNSKLNMLANELQVLHNRIDTLSSRLERLEIGIRDPYAQDRYSRMAEKLMRDAGEELKIGPITNPSSPLESIKENKPEIHPAQNSSFVLKI